MSYWTRYATETATIKRAAIVGGKRGQPIDYLAGLSCAPVLPLSGPEAGELLTRLRWDTPHTAKETYLVGAHAIETGDVLEVGGKGYTVRAVNEWAGLATGITPLTHLVLEEVR